MITKRQAEDVVRSISYRGWKFAPTQPRTTSQFITDPGLERVYVTLSYKVPDSTKPGEFFDNSFDFDFSLPETEAEVARAVYEAIRVIEDHERREFFEVNRSVIKDRATDPARDTFADLFGFPQKSQQGDNGSNALFHPHGVNRTAMFHALDPFGAKVSQDLRAYGEPFIADAV